MVLVLLYYIYRLRMRTRSLPVPDLFRSGDFQWRHFRSRDWRHFRSGDVTSGSSSSQLLLKLDFVRHYVLLVPDILLLKLQKYRSAKPKAITIKPLHLQTGLHTFSIISKFLKFYFVYHTIVAVIMFRQCVVFHFTILSDISFHYIFVIILNHYVPHDMKCLSWI